MIEKALWIAHDHLKSIIWAAAGQNQQNDICTQQYSDQGICPVWSVFTLHEETLGP